MGLPCLLSVLLPCGEGSLLSLGTYQGMRPGCDRLGHWDQGWPERAVSRTRGAPQLPRRDKVSGAPQLPRRDKVSGSGPRTLGFASSLEEQRPQNSLLRWSREPPSLLLQALGQPTRSDACMVPQWPPLGQGSLHGFHEQDREVTGVMTDSHLSPFHARILKKAGYSAKHMI